MLAVAAARSKFLRELTNSLPFGNRQSTALNNKQNCLLVLKHPMRRGVLLTDHSRHLPRKLLAFAVYKS